MARMQTRLDATKLITEKAFQQAVVDLARLNGWLCYHTYDSRRSEAGFPDLVLVKGRVLIFAELKKEKGRLTKDQAAWREALWNVPKIGVCLWRPSDWNAIKATLERED